MNNTLLKTLPIWTAAQTRKSKGRGRSVDNLSQHGINKLRELILELAVRGKLVPQDPNDEPAAVLLEKIAAEKKRLIKEGKIKKQKPLPDIGEDERPFDLRKGGIWCRLGDITNYGITDKAEPNSVNNNTWVLELEDIEKVTSRLLQKIMYSKRQFRSSKNYFKTGDVLYGKLRPYLDKVLVADEDGVCTTEIIPIRGYCEILPEFLRLLLKTPFFISYANDSTHGMNLPRLGTEKARMALVPIFPLAEQQRIVAKVDELMALCDQLEQQHSAHTGTHATLVRTLLGTLTSAGSATELANAWQRLAPHFNTLFTTEDSIDQLKQTILQLAVMGKLVPQNPADEPASELLKKIAAEKKRLVKNEKIKKQKPLPEIGEDEKSFDLPRGWEFVRLGNLSTRIGSGSTPRGGRAVYKDSGIIFLRSQNVWNHGLELDDVAYISEKTHAKMANTYVYPNDILLNITGASLGRCTIFPDGIGEANVSQHVTIIRPVDADLNSYLHVCILSPYTQKLVWGRQVGMAREGLSKKVLELFEIPLPPLAEQHRIVAKVNALFALCDQLKTRLSSANTMQIQLANAIVEQAVQI